MRVLLLILCLAISAAAQTLEYDKYTDTTYYTSKRVEIYRNKGGLLVYSPARVEAQAIKTTGKPNFRLWLDVDSYDWQFTGQCLIYVLADGKPYQFPCEVSDARAYTLRYDVYVRESLRMTILTADFRQILNSKSVSFRVGAYDFKLKDKHIKELIKVDVPEIFTKP